MAQNYNDSIPNNELNEVIITGTKTKRQLSLIPLPAQTISEDQIKKTNSSRLKDILDEQVGIIIVSDFGGGEGIQIQGLDSEYILILMDGLPIIGRQSGTLDLNRIAIGNIKQIELIKGSSSSLYGSEALGGVVNLISSDNKDSLSLNFDYKFASYNTNDINLSTGIISKDGKKFNIFINSYSSDGYDLDNTDNLNTIDPFKNYTGHLKYSFKKENLFFSSSARGFDEKQNFKIDENYFGNNNILEWNSNSRINYKISDSFNIESDIYLTSYNSQEKISSNSMDQEEGFFDQFLLKTEVRTIIDLWNRDKLTLGLGFYDESLSRNNFYKNKVSQYSINLFSQLEGFISNNTNYIIGARYDDYNNYKSQISPRIAIRTKLFEDVFFKSSIGRGFKAPDFRQLYFNFSNSTVGYSVIGFNVVNEVIYELTKNNQIVNLVVPIEEFNEELKPESSFSINAGFKYYPSNNVKLDINLFRNDIDNLIDYKVIANKKNGQNVFSYFNLNKVYTQGIESTFNFKPNRKLDIILGYQFLEAKDKNIADSIKDGEIYARESLNSPSFKLMPKDYFGLYNRSKHTFNFKIYFEAKNNLSINLRSKYRTKYGLFDSNGNDFLDIYDEFVKGYLISDFALLKNINSSLSLSLGADNLFNYKDSQNITNLPGRIVYVKINLTI
ncbi:MAG: TonB-dependent receptor [Bacteroidota bacterium]|nr:TonB-dependent receptor [Bacteroidota bacterium]